MPQESGIESITKGSHSGGMSCSAPQCSAATFFLLGTQHAWDPPGSGPCISAPLPPDLRPLSMAALKRATHKEQFATGWRALLHVRFCHVRHALSAHVQHILQSKGGWEGEQQWQGACRWVAEF